jgi:hypothetical protein
VYAADAPNQYLPGLQPDLLGEAMVLRIAAGKADHTWIDRVIVVGTTRTLSARIRPRKDVWRRACT